MMPDPATAAPAHPHPTLRAPTIAHPLWLALRVRPFRGRIAARFERAAQLADDGGRVIALTQPTLGRGPFSLLLPETSAIWASLRPDQPVHMDADSLTVGDAELALHDAEIWDPTLPGSTAPFNLARALVPIVQPLAAWPPLAAQSAVHRAAARLLARGSDALLAAIERQTGIAAAAIPLAGLGPGLTPAGDDFVLGTMAALWLLGRREPLPAMAAVIVPYTTQLSGAFLLAAAQGHFMDIWHDLVQALAHHDAASSHAAIHRIAGFGATSGHAALAGFAGVLLQRSLMNPLVKGGYNGVHSHYHHIALPSPASAGMSRAGHREGLAPVRRRYWGGDCTAVELFPDRCYG